MKIRQTAAAITAAMLVSAIAVNSSGSYAAGPARTPALVAAAPPESSFFSTAQVDAGATIGAPAVGDNRNHGDLWPNCWSGDDNVYTAYGDGIGFGGTFSDIGVSRISGGPGSLTGAQLASGNQVGQIWTPNHSRKPTGMVCVDGALYLAVQDLAFDFNAAPAATIVKSVDKGRTWTWNRSAPMFDGSKFTTIMFLDYGKDNVNSPDSFVYAYGLDNNWRDSFDDRVPDPVDLYLARVPKNAIQDRTAWRFFAGSDAAGGAQWTADINQRVSSLHDDRRIYQNVGTAGRARNLSMLSQGGVLYNKPLNRYIYTSWTEYTFEFYESPTPWGPWKHFTPKDFGGYPWTHTKHGGYATTIPSKYLSADGKSMWLQSNVCPCGGGYPAGDHWAYTFSLRRMSLEPSVATIPNNPPGSGRNLAREPGTVPIERATHYGQPIYNDGNRTQSEDDWNDERKPTSWWGYTWPRSYNLNKVVYTTGTMFGDGGWFSTAPTVQIRRNGVWNNVTGLRVAPGYPTSNAAGTNRSYTFSFDTATGDGVRIIGGSGGSQTFTSIAELEVYHGSLPAGSYRVRAEVSGSNRVLDVTDCHTNDGADVRIWDRITTSPCQAWTVDALGNDTYKIIDRNSGKALGIAGCSTADAAVVQLSTVDDTNCQRWRIEPTGGGAYNVIAAGTGKSLDVSGCSPAAGADVIVWPYHGESCQRWYFEPA